MGSICTRPGRFLQVFSLKTKAKANDVIEFELNEKNRPRILSRKRLLFQKDKVFVTLINFFRDFLEQRLSALPKELEIWNETLFLADWSGIMTSTLEDFKHLGILHILVLSGLHVEVFRRIAQITFLAIPWGLFVTGIISPRKWLFALLCSEVLVVLIVLCFLAIIGGKVPILRAVLFYILSLLSARFLGERNLWQVINLIWCIQSLLLPGESLSLGSLMSWLASTMLLTSKYWKPRYALLAKVYQNVGLMLLAFIVFGEVSSLAWLVNLVISPFFPLVLVISLMSFSV